MTPVDDVSPEGDENVTVELTPHSSYTYLPSASAAAVILDNDVSVWLDSVADAEEGRAAPGYFRLKRNTTNGLLNVDYAIDPAGTTATNGSDFAWLPGTGPGDETSGQATFPDGQDTLDIPVDAGSAYDDEDVEGTETVKIYLTGGAGGQGATYQIGAPSDQTVGVKENERPRFDPDPVQNPSHYQVTFGADRPQGHKVLDVNATDPESDAITYAITAGNGDGVFAIGATDGIITLTKEAWLAQTDRYTLEVEARDAKGAAAKTNVEVTIKTAVGMIADTHAVENVDPSLRDDIEIRFRRYQASGVLRPELTVQFNVTWGSGDGFADQSDLTGGGLSELLYGSIVIGVGQLESDPIVLEAVVNSYTRHVETFRVDLAATPEYVPVSDDGPKVDDPRYDTRCADPALVFRVLDGTTLFVRGEDEVGELSEQNPGIHKSDVKQGSVADCYFMAVVTELAISCWPQIQTRFTCFGGQTYVQNGEYEVELFLTPTTTQKFRVPAKLDRGQDMARLPGDMDENGLSEVWPIILERAYAARRGGYKFLTKAGSSVEDAWLALTGMSGQCLACGGMTDLAILQQIQAAHGNGKRIVIGIKQSAPQYTNVVADHAYVFLGFNADGSLNLHNPWGHEHAVLSLDHLDEAIGEISFLNPL